ncbi:MAG: hypothetical protein MZV70_50950 [Desulfobacterales bacterium]|nr:hypothetical protein [Desulfobacterales bacterium]
MVYDTDRIISVSPAMQKAMAQHPAAGPDRIHHPDHRRNRHRQELRLRQHPLQQPAPPQALHQGELRQHPGDTAGKRAVRPRAGRLHRRRQDPHRPLRAGPRRHPVPGRVLRALLRAAVKAAAGARGQVLRTAGRQQDHPGRRAGHRRHQPRHRGPRAPGQLPRRPLLPHQRAADPPAAAARTPRGHRTDGPLPAGQAVPLPQESRRRVSRRR